MNPAILDIETAALDAWPALQVEVYDGWVLGFSRGYTKRANSVNALTESSLDLTEKVRYCEQVYQLKGLPPIFRISPLCPTGLDDLLEARGYTLFHPTRVMVLDLEKWSSPLSHSPELHESGLDTWLEIFAAASGSPIESGSPHREILEAIQSPCLYASLTAGGGQYAACGLGVLSGIYIGLFDIFTRPAFRKRGYGTRLVAGMLAWAKAGGAAIAYLQVMEDNQPARILYRKLGYRDFYSYWYRVPQG